MGTTSKRHSFQKYDFQKFKNTITSEPIIIDPNFEELFLLTTDASTFATERVISQVSVDKDLPTTCSSRILWSAET